MKAHQKLKQWRENDIGMSTYELADFLEKKMAPDFPNGFKRGEKVFQSDIVLAEKGNSRKRFEKVTAVIYKYLEVPEAHFGRFVAAQPDEAATMAEGQTDEYRRQTIDLQTRLLDAHELINRLNTEKVELLQRNFELQTENMELKRRIEENARQ